SRRGAGEHSPDGDGHPGGGAGRARRYLAVEGRTSRSRQHEGATSKGPDGSAGGRGDSRVRLSSGGAAGENQRGPLETRSHRRPHSETLPGEIAGTRDPQRHREEAPRRVLRIGAGATGRAGSARRTASRARTAQAVPAGSLEGSSRNPRCPSGASASIGPTRDRRHDARESRPAGQAEGPAEDRGNSSKRRSDR